MSLCSENASVCLPRVSWVCDLCVDTHYGTLDVVRVQASLLLCNSQGRVHWVIGQLRKHFSVLQHTPEKEKNSW